MRNMAHLPLLAGSLLALRGGGTIAPVALRGGGTIAPVDAPSAAPFISPTAIGIALACVAATMNASGLNLQRWASVRGSAILNVIGLILSSSCGLLDMASFAFAPQSLLAPFGALTLVINLLVAAPLHGDVIAKSDLLSTFLVVSGVATCLANANTKAADRSYKELTALLWRPQFHAWLALVVASLGAATARLRTAGTAMCYPLIAGGIGGFTTLCAKSVGELGKAGAPWHVSTLVGAGIPIFALCASRRAQATPAQSALQHAAQQATIRLATESDNATS